MALSASAASSRQLQAFMLSSAHLHGAFSMASFLFQALFFPPFYGLTLKFIEQNAPSYVPAIVALVVGVVASVVGTKMLNKAA
ncbi:hypothetical protein [Thiomicrospira sp. WB1]|uniref:hypothetical protein n=1 Tax=Thiomicrospira sp. WB1 TaxID=1685380 RepID=UPI0007488C02|nr:hypothetical protein [Thiomicrospira sp. WB1]KUJ71653.1 hypothetical protein AVO41_09065 [Thiomicrospira sp. WB1]